MTRRPTVKAQFLPDVLRSSLVKDGARVMLLHMCTVTEVDAAGVYGGYPMTLTGRVKVSREELAEALGITVKEVSNRIAEAVKAGLLVKASGGRNGQVAGYQAHPQGHARNAVQPAAQTNPSSLAAFVHQLGESVNGGVVGTPVGVPGEASERVLGTPVGAPYARAHYVTTTAAHTAPADSRANRDHEVTEQASNYRGWMPTPVTSSSYDYEEEIAV